MASESLFTTWHDEHRPVDALLDSWPGHEREVYAEAVRVDGLDAVVTEEWDAMRHPASAWATTREAAQEATSSLRGRCVVEVTRETLREALVQWLGLVEGD